MEKTVSRSGAVVAMLMVGAFCFLIGFILGIPTGKNQGYRQGQIDSYVNQEIDYALETQENGETIWIKKEKGAF
jgi:hypothetical protein